MISLLISVIVLGVIAYIVFWGINYIGIPEPFDKIARVILVVIIVIYLLKMLLPFLEGGNLLK